MNAVIPLITGPNEVKIIVRVLDANDNGPRFVGNGRPIVAAIPSSATYGFPIAKLHVSERVKYQGIWTVQSYSSRKIR